MREIILRQHFGETPVIAIFCFNPKQMAITDAKQNRPSVVGGGSVYPSVENLLIACRAEGLGCVLTTLLCEVEPQVKELLAIPEGWGTAAAIPIGYPVGAATARSSGVRSAILPISTRGEIE